MSDVRQTTSRAPHPRFAAMPIFSIGDRVRVKPETAKNWVDPKLRSRAEKGRVATVKAVIGTACAHWQRSYGLQFDRVGREHAFYHIIPVDALEAAP